jgi:hypothetical protein
VCAAGLLAAACGGSAAPSRDAANTRVCGHYRTQRAHVKSLAEPTLADAVKFATWVAADAAEATPGTPLARDLAAMSTAEQDGTSSYAASARVLKDCTALGVTFQP